MAARSLYTKILQRDAVPSQLLKKVVTPCHNGRSFSGAGSSDLAPSGFSLCDHKVFEKAKQFPRKLLANDGKADDIWLITEYDEAGIKIIRSPRPPRLKGEGLQNVRMIRLTGSGRTRPRNRMRAGYNVLIINRFRHRCFYYHGMYFGVIPLSLTPTKISKRVKGGYKDATCLTVAKDNKLSFITATLRS